MNAFALAETGLVPWPLRMGVSEAYGAVKERLEPERSYRLAWSEAEPDGLFDEGVEWEAWLVARPVDGDGKVVCPVLVDADVRRGQLRRELAELVAADDFVWAAN